MIAALIPPKGHTRYNGGVLTPVCRDAIVSSLSLRSPGLAASDYDPYVVPKCPIIVSVTGGTRGGNKG
jgi:hypothetical protein